jgi:hypothetical protein
MKTLAWLVRPSFYVLLAISFDCGGGGQASDAAVGRDSPQPTPQPDSAEVQSDVAPDVADSRAAVAPDVVDASMPGDASGPDQTASDGASIVDGSGDVEDGGARVCWYEKARTGAALPGFGFSFVAPDGVTYTCSYDPRKDAGPPWPRDLRGVVTSVSATQLTLDTCVAQDGCDPGIYTFIVNAPGLALTVPVGRRVRVQWQITVSWGCTSWLQVSDDTSDPLGTVWLVGNQGFQKPPFELPFDVSLDQLLSCRHPADAQASCSGALTGDYAFRFSSKVGPASTLSLGTQESGSFTFQDAAGVAKTLDIHCLQAFQTVMCDDYWSWSFWAVSTPAIGAPIDAASDW